MKKVLFASTALFLTAGVAAADVTISGSANMGLYYSDAAGNTIVKNEIDFDVKGSGETDGGISFGASVDLDADSNNSAHTTGGGASDPEVFISYEGLTLTVGDIGEANDVGGIADVGFDGLGVDDIVDVLRETGSDDVRIDYSFGDIAVAVSADSSNDEYAISMSGSIDAFSVSVGYADRTFDNTATVTLGYSAGAFSVNATYADSFYDTDPTAAVVNASADGWGIDASYTTGDLTLTAVYAERDTAGTKADAYGIGVAYDLGGATLAGGFGEVNGDQRADLGISFKF
ncbi:MAG: porin [Cognatishimia sp.]|nr:porin [Cognatishimia sp.]